MYTFTKLTHYTKESINKFQSAAPTKMTSKSLHINNSQINDLHINMFNEKIPPKNITLNYLRAASYFQGRLDTFADLQRLFRTNQLVVMYGISAIGKTETARHFANRNCEHYNGNLIWILAETPESIEKCFDNLAITFDLRITDVSQIYNKFTSAKALFVFDGAPNMATIKKYLPSGQLHPNVNVLITSHYSEWDSTVCKVHLNSLNLEDALDILKEKLGDKFQKYPIEIWQELVEDLDRIPFCIQNVSTRIFKKISGFPITLSELEDLINECKEDYIDLSVPTSDLNHYDKTVFEAISSVLNRLEAEEAHHALDLLCYMAYIKSDIPFLFLPITEEFEVKLHEVINKLVDYSLIHVTKGPWRQVQVKVLRTVQLVVRKYDFQKGNRDILKNLLMASEPDEYLKPAETHRINFIRSCIEASYYYQIY